jgi:nuclear pore complex protein Nup107
MSINDYSQSPVKIASKTSRKTYDSPLFSRHAQTLQEKVDDIGNEVEKFGEEVDKWLTKRRSILDDDLSGRFEAAKDLLNKLQLIVKEKHAHTTKSDDGHAQTDLTSSWRRTIESLKPSTPRSSTSVALRESSSEPSPLSELRKWKAEVDSWDLLRAVTDLERAKAASALQQVNNFAPVDQHSSNADLWSRFIFEDDEARERKVILEWLENTAQTSETSFESIVEQLESRTGTGSGTWSHGWLYTREKIKGEKRAPSLRHSTMRSSNNSESLVTELDPDAPTRQRLVLEKEDQHYERSLWLACYEMVRRGQPWDEVREWFEARNETWRAASLGAAQDLDRKQNRLCLGGPYAGALWRRMCFEASQQTSADKYEHAVYGLLAGDTKSVEPVCKSWQDHVYMNYNSLLLGSFEAWLQKNHPTRLPSTFTQKFPLFKPLDSSEDYRTQIMDHVLQRPEISAETNKPINFIQANLIAGTFQGLIEDLGRAIAQSAAERASKLIHPPPRPNIVRVGNYEEFLLDWNVLRVVVHMIIILKEAGHDFDERLEVQIRDIIVAYIDILRLMGKIGTIPTYAMFLPTPYRNHVMGMILFDVTNQTEQDQLVTLMGQAGLNVRDILSDQFIYASARLELQPGMGTSIERFEIIEEASDRWAGWRVKEDFKAPDDTNNFMDFISEDQARAVRALQWFFRCNSTWDTTFFGITFVMKQFLRK